MSSVPNKDSITAGLEYDVKSNQFRYPQDLPDRTSPEDRRSPLQHINSSATLNKQDPSMTSLAGLRKPSNPFGHSPEATNALDDTSYRAKNPAMEDYITQGVNQSQPSPSIMKRYEMNYNTGGVNF